MTGPNPMFDLGTLDRLMETGRAKGGLTNEDLEAALPIGSMSAEDIALVVVQLEDAGIPVELDESLLTPRPPGERIEIPAVEIVRPGKDAAQPVPQRPVTSASVIGTSPPAPAEAKRHGTAPTRTSLALAGLAVLALLVVALLLWR